MLRNTLLCKCDAGDKGQPPQEEGVPHTGTGILWSFPSLHNSVDKTLGFSVSGTTQPESAGVSLVLTPARSP